VGGFEVYGLEIFIRGIVGSFKPSEGWMNAQECGIKYLDEYLNEAMYFGTSLITRIHGLFDMEN